MKAKGIQLTVEETEVAVGDCVSGEAGLSAKEDTDQHKKETVDKHTEAVTESHLEEGAGEAKPEEVKSE